MRNAILVLVLSILPVTAGGCLVACNLPPAVVTNAIAAAQAAAQTATTLVSDAQAAWPAVKVLLPADKQASAQDAFDKAVFTANHALLALNDGITAAIAADNSKPDFTSLLSALGDAAMAVIAVVQEFRALPVAAPGIAATQHGPLDEAISDMNRAARGLKSSSAPASSK